MKKNKIYFIFCIIIIFIFGSAAICNLCGIAPAAANIPAPETNATADEESNPTADEESNTTQAPSAATEAQETVIKTTLGEGGTTTKPHINLERIYGPVIEGGLCVQRFKASITGLPKPTINWNHDDSNGAFGEDIAQVNLKSGEGFDLKVTVTNSAGSDTATIHVNYELPTTPPESAQLVDFTFEPKSGPEGAEVALKLSSPIDSPVEVYYNGQKILWVIFTKTASPDGKTLTVNIPAGAVSGYFELKYDGKTVPATEQFTVTNPPQADIEITNVRSYSSTSGDTILVDIKNVGTADLSNAGIHVVCQALGISMSDPSNKLPAGSDQWIYVTVKAGAADYFFPHLILDFGLYVYPVVACSIILDGDPTPDNNEFVISIP